MRYCAFDTETTGLYPFKGDKIFSYSIGSIEKGITIKRLDGKDKTNPKESRKFLQDFLDDTSIGKVCHNLKFDYTMLKLNGFHIPENTEWHDTMIMSQLLQNNNPHHSLDYLCWQFGKYPRELDEEVSSMGREYKGYQNVPVNKMHSYQVADAERGLLLFMLFYPYFQQDSILMADYQVEIDLIKTTFELENRGMMLHAYETKKLREWLENEVSDIQNQLYKIIGEYLNLNSPIQVNYVLFKKLKLPVVKINEDTGNTSTDKDVLLELRKSNPHPVIDLIIKQRSYTKGIGIIKNYLKNCIDGVIHPEIRTNEAGTGRESSRNPNLQNVSKKEALKNLFPVPARKCFRPRPGFVFLLYDYAGIEMRLIADAVDETELIELAKEGKDLHAPAAEIFFGKNYTKIQRTAAKNGQFAIGYGAGADTLADTLMIPIEDAIAAHERYSERFKRVASYASDTMDEIRQHGFIKTAFGRKLYINRELAYVGANYKIQGTAAGIIKRAQNNIRKNVIPRWDGLYMIMPVHDEIIFELSRDLLNKKEIISQDIAKAMTIMPEIKIRLDIEGKISTTTWNDAKEFKF